MSGMFITKFTNVSAFWRRKFRRSPRLQYSVITSTGPDEETHHSIKNMFACKLLLYAGLPMNWLLRSFIDMAVLYLNFTQNKDRVLSDPHRCRLPVDWQCSCGVPGGSGSSVQTSELPSHLNGHWLQKHSTDCHHIIIPYDHVVNSWFRISLCNIFRCLNVFSTFFSNIQTFGIRSDLLM